MDTIITNIWTAYTYIEHSSIRRPFIGINSSFFQLITPRKKLLKYENTEDTVTMKKLTVLLYQKSEKSTVNIVH
jgi:hypothetical protein